MYLETMEKVLKAKHPETTEVAEQSEGRLTPPPLLQRLGVDTEQRLVGNLSYQPRPRQTLTTMVTGVGRWEEREKLNKREKKMKHARREQGRLDEAEQELGTLVARAREGWGAQDLDTLEAEAVAARLRHAQPDGAAAGAAELRTVVERMTEFLGAEHQYTVKWQRVLEGVSADS